MQILYIFWRPDLCLGYHWQIYFLIQLVTFSFFWFSFTVQKLLNLIKFHLFILSFMSHALGDMSVRMLLHGMSEIFLPVFSSRTFMVLQLVFKSFIHLEFIFVYGVNW